MTDTVNEVMTELDKGIEEAVTDHVDTAIKGATKKSNHLTMAISLAAEALEISPRIYMPALVNALTGAWRACSLELSDLQRVIEVSWEAEEQELLAIEAINESQKVK